jgi:thioredoxin-like negative regulator of GroEL
MARARLITSAELDKIVRKEKQTAIVLFFGDWCIDCRNFKPTWEQWIGRCKEKVLMVEVLRGGQEWEDWALDEIPTVAVFSEGVESARVAGTISSDDLDMLGGR